MSSSISFDPHQFRRALGNFACGVTIVTAIDPDGNKVGVTANSFNSVSLDPPLILWSLDKRSSALETIQAAGHFTVNILASDQIELSNQFARPAEDKFAGITFNQGFGGAPVFNGCSGNFQCSLFQHIDAGDHWILIGKVETFEDYGRAPLVYHQGGYSMVLPHPQGAKPNQDNSEPSPPLLNTRLGKNLFYLMIQAVNTSHTRFVEEHAKQGLHNIESRLLMVLDSAPNADLEVLQKAVSMPKNEIEEAMLTLQSKGYLNGREVTRGGQNKLKNLWNVVQTAQDELFSGLSEGEIEVFKKALRQIIATR